MAEQDGTLAAAHARGLLLKVFGIRWPDKSIISEEEEERQMEGKETDEENSLMAYPNPSSNTVTFRYHTNEKEEVYLNIFSMQGHMFKSVPVDTDKNSTTVDFSSLQAGTYLVSLLTENGVQASCQVIIIK